MSEDASVTDTWGDPDPGRVWQPGVGQTAPPPAPGQWPPPAPGQAPAPYPAPGQVPYYPGYGLPAPWAAPPRDPWRVVLLRVVRSDLPVFAATVTALVLLGAPFALLWRAFAPHAVILHTASGPQPAAPESSQMFAVDGSFAVVSAVAGLALGVLLWVLLRRRGPAAPLGIAAGGVLAAWIASAVGRRMVVDRYLYDFCHRGDIKCIVYDGTLHLHALPALVVLPVALLVAFAGLTMAFDRED